TRPSPPTATELGFFKPVASTLGARSCAGARAGRRMNARAVTNQTKRDMESFLVNPVNANGVGIAHDGTSNCVQKARRPGYLVPKPRSAAYMGTVSMAVRAKQIPLGVWRCRRAPAEISDPAYRRRSSLFMLRLDIIGLMRPWNVRV